MIPPLVDEPSALKRRVILLTVSVPAMAVWLAVTSVHFWAVAVFDAIATAWCEFWSELGWSVGNYVVVTAPVRDVFGGVVFREVWAGKRSGPGS